MSDYKGYTESLEKILEGATKDYWTSYVDINRHQVNVGKTYLWVAAALIGIYAAAYEKFQDQFFLNSCFIVLGIIAFSLSALAFGICLYAIPARKGYKTIPDKGWGEFSNEAYEILKADSKQVYATFLTSHISKIDHAFAYNFKTNQNRAWLLRFTSWLLIISFAVAIFVASSVSINTLINHNTPSEVQTMSDDDTNTQSSTEPKLDVPKPPPPADTGSSSVSTHSVDNAGSGESTFYTESKDD